MEFLSSAMNHRWMVVQKASGRGMRGRMNTRGKDSQLPHEKACPNARSVSDKLRRD